jgi:hypothetical protein
MRFLWVTMGVLVVVAQSLCCAQSQPPMPAGQLVREVVYNELHDHERHGYWRFSVERHAQNETSLAEQVETAAGPVTRQIKSNGHPLDAAASLAEQHRLELLLNSADEQAHLRQAHDDDEKRIGRIVALLPDAFLYEYDGMENGCYRLRFRPNPNYPPHSIEARIFHAMSGELWVDARYKRLARLDGRIEENVNFGYGILGRLNKGGWFSLQRTQVSATDWKTERLEIHMNGRALLFKTIARETSERRSGFVQVPAGITLAQGVTLLDQPPADRAMVLPAGLEMSR